MSWTRHTQWNSGMTNYGTVMRSDAIFKFQLHTSKVSSISFSPQRAGNFHTFTGNIYEYSSIYFFSSLNIRAQFVFVLPKNSDGSPCVFLYLEVCGKLCVRLCQQIVKSGGSRKLSVRSGGISPRPVIFVTSCQSPVCPSAQNGTLEHCSPKRLRPPQSCSLSTSCHHGHDHGVLLRLWLTLSLPRVINVKFPLQPHRKYYMTQCEELDFP